MKKYFLLFMLMFLFMPIVNASPSGKYVISAPNTIEAGKEFEVKISLSMDFGEYAGVSACSFNLSFNKNNVSYVKHTKVSKEALTDEAFMLNGNSIYYGMQIHPYTNPKVSWLSTTTFKVDANTPEGTKLVFSVEKGAMELLELDGGSWVGDTNISGATKTITVGAPKVAKSKNSSLKSISVDGYNLEPSFDKNTLEYSLTVPFETEELDIKYETDDAKAKANINGNKQLKIGENKATILVTAEDGTKKTYTINIIREEEVQDNSNNNSDTASDNSNNNDNKKKYVVPAIVGSGIIIIGGISFTFWKKRKTK